MTPPSYHHPHHHLHAQLTLPAVGRLLVHLVTALLEQQQGALRLIQQVPDVDPQVLVLVPLGLRGPHAGLAVGLPHLGQQPHRLGHQVGQVGRAVLQAQPGVGAQLVELLQPLQCLVHHPPVPAVAQGPRTPTVGFGATMVACSHV